MIVLFLFATSYALYLTNLENFEIELNANCQKYFVFRGKDDCVYFHQSDGQFELQVTQNDSQNTSNYAVYTSPWTDSLKFEWPFFHVNNKTMDLIRHNGSIEYPLNFYSEMIPCEVFGVSAGTLISVELAQKVFKCPMLVEDSLITVIVVLILALVGVKNESIRAILGPRVSWIFWGCQQILSRSQETTSKRDSDRYSQFSKDSESVHLAQANSETQKVSKDSIV